MTTKKKRIVGLGSGDTVYGYSYPMDHKKKKKKKMMGYY